MRLGIITTSRADYGIYHSLLAAMQSDPDVNYALLVSGTHLDPARGFTVREIEQEGHPIEARVPLDMNTDGPARISETIGQAIVRFAQVYAGGHHRFDAIIALGDRYEMFAAVAALLPFVVPLVHLHGGETTRGAIDDRFRHAITQMADLHFTATSDYAKRVAAMVGHDRTVHYVGAPALDGLEALSLPSTNDLIDDFGIDFNLPTILTTFHPETVDYRSNNQHAEVVVDALKRLSEKYQIVITLPNADTAGEVVRRAIIELSDRSGAIKAVEHFGRLNYFAAMHSAAFLLGNSSSGLIEAPSFGKYAINIGRRQEGRARSNNVLDVDFNVERILIAAREIEERGFVYNGENVYYKDGYAGRQILRLTKEYLKQSAPS